MSNDYYDNLRTCPVCEDRYITDSETMCHACLRQEMIDGVPPQGYSSWFEYEISKMQIEIDDMSDPNDAPDREANEQ